MAKFGFSPAEVDVNAQTSFDPLPAGDYCLKAVEADEKTTKSGDGQYIKVKFEVVKGEYAGRLVWMNFNIVNPSEKAQNIGRQQIVAWATACGKPNADDTDKLIDKPFMCTLKIEKSVGYADSNSIKAFLFDKDDAPAPAAKPAAAKAAPAAKSASAKGANPWD